MSTEVELVPPDRVGPLRVGMSRQQVSAVFETYPGGLWQRRSGMAVNAAYDDAGLAIAINVQRPFRDGFSDRVLFRGIDVFGQTASAVIGELRGAGFAVDEDGAGSIALLDLHMILYRRAAATEDADDDSPVFQGVFVGGPPMGRPLESGKWRVG